MATPQSRLTWLREALFGARGKTAMARLLGIRLTSYVRYEQDRVMPTDTLAKLVAAKRVNPRWYSSGEGEPFLPENVAVPPMEDAASLIADLWEGLDEANKKLTEYETGKAPAVPVRESGASAPYRRGQPAVALWELAAIRREGKHVTIRRVNDAPGPLRLYGGDEAAAELINRKGATDDDG